MPGTSPPNVDFQLASSPMLNSGTAQSSPFICSSIAEVAIDLGDFALAQANAPQFPALSALWEAYYDDPRISSAQASALLHELIALLAINGGSANKSLVNSVVRLLPFFSMASQGGHEIRTQSD